MNAQALDYSEVQKECEAHEQQIVPICHYWTYSSVDTHGVFEVYPTSLTELPIHHPTGDSKYKITHMHTGKITDG